MPILCGVAGPPTSSPSLIKETPNRASESKHIFIISLYRSSNTCSGIVAPGNNTVLSGNSGRSRFSGGIFHKEDQKHGGSIFISTGINQYLSQSKNCIEIGSGKKDDLKTGHSIDNLKRVKSNPQ